MSEPHRITGPHPIGISHKNHMVSPLGRPSSEPHQMIKSCPRNLIVCTRRIVRKLIQKRIRLIRNTLAISIHKNARKRRRLYRITAQLPNPIEHRIRTLKRRGVVIPSRIKRGTALNIHRTQFARQPFNFNPSERQYHPPLLRSKDCRRMSR